MATNRTGSGMTSGMTSNVTDAHAIVHGNVPFNPTVIGQMESIERAHGGVNPDALIPRLRIWWTMKWGKFWGL